MAPVKDRIFCVGMNKTGTTTLHECLSILGYKSAHYHLKGKDPQEGWIEHIKNSDYEAFSDWPMCRKGFFKNLAASFPEAKFILTVRKDPQTWSKSAEKFFEYTPFWHLYQKGGTLIERIREYEEHNQEVRNFFKGKTNFLELKFDAGDAHWEKLCMFLNKTIPSVSFPHAKPKNRKYLKVILQRIKLKIRALLCSLGLWGENEKK